MGKFHFPVSKIWKDHGKLAPLNVMFGVAPIQIFGNVIRVGRVGSKSAYPVLLACKYILQIIKKTGKNNRK